MSLATLDLDLEVFHGPFDLLLTLVLREEIDLLEVDLAEVVLAYVEHLERAGELDLEAATEFLVLIAALLELKSRLMLPQEDEEGLDLEPQEAAEELLARMLEYHRYRGAAQHLRDRLEAEHGYRYRSAPLPPRAAARVARGGRGRPTTRCAWPRRSAACWRCRRRSTCATCARPPCRSSSAWRTCATLLAARQPLLLRRRGQGRRPPDRGGHPVRPARALQGRRGEVGAGGAVRPDHGRWRGVNDLPAPSRRCCSCPPSRSRSSGSPRPARSSEGEIVEALARLREHYAEGFRGVVLREVAGGFTLATDPVAERAARRLLAKPRTPPLTQAQAECLAIVAYLQPGLAPRDRAHPRRGLGVRRRHAARARADRGVGPLALRRGALPHHRPVREAVRPRPALDALPDPAAFDPSPEDEGELRERLLRAGEQRRRARRRLGPCAGGRAACSG